MKLKKLTGILLALSIVFSSGFVIVGAETDPSFSAQLLKTLGIIKSEDAFDGTENITRGYFTALVSRALMIDGSGEDIRTVFRDVAPDYEYAAEIAGMYRVGNISGDLERKFYPEENITVYDAITILVSSLGYKQRAEANGGYPTGYVTEARRLKLSVDKPGDSFLTQQESADRILDMLEADALTASGVSGEDVIYTETGKLLNTLHDVYTEEGIVTENGITGLSSASSSENSILINGIRLKNNTGEDLSGLLGMSVKVYYKDDNGSLYYIASKGTINNTVYELNGWDNEPVYKRSSNSVAYYVDDREKTLRLSGEFIFIYNGRAEENYLKYISDFKNSTLKLIDNNGDGSCDVLIVENWKVMVVDSVNSETETIINKYAPADSLKLRDYETVYFTDMSGRTLTAGSVSAGDILNYIVSADGEYIKIIKSNLQISGTVTGTAPGENSYLIDGKEYKASGTVQSGAVKLEAGKSGDFYLDIFGRIAELREESGGKNFGLLISFRKSNTMNEEIQLKILTEYRDLRVYKLAEKTEIDGTVYKLASAYSVIAKKAAENDGSSYLEEDVIRYSVNDADEINYLEFALANPPAKSAAEEDRLYIYKTNPGNGLEKSTRWYKSESGNFNDEFIIDKTSTVIFGVDDSFEYGNDDRYYTATSSIFKNDKTYRVAAYTTKREPDKAEVVVYHGTKSADMKFFAINNIQLTMNADGEKIYKAQGFSRDADGEILLSEKIVNKYNLTGGDIIGAIKTDSQDAVYECSLIYDYSEDKVLENKWDGLIYDERQYMIYPYSVSGTVIKWAKAATREEAHEILSSKNITEGDLNQVTVPASRIYVKNDKGEIYRKGTMADIVSYVNDSVNYSDIMVYSLWGNLKLIIIFN